MKEKSIHRLFLILFLLIISINQISYAVMRMPSENRECASCHIMWLSDFKREDVSTLIPFNPKPVEKTGKEDVASTDAMCYSCHDGFVLESRFLWKEGNHAHPVGVKPSKNISIPIVDGKNVFPLNDDGKVYCGTCHTAHGVDWGQKEAAVFMRVRNENGKLCMLCHKDKTKGPNHGSHPVNVKIQKLVKAPPASLLKAGARFAKDGGVVCQSCHRAHAAPEKKMLLQKNDKSQLCKNCHSEKLEVAKSKHDMSYMAPDAKNARGKKADESGICGSCHLMHDALGPKLWGRKSMPGQGTDNITCLGCHNKDGLAKNKSTDMSHTHPMDVPVNDLGIDVTLDGWFTRLLKGKVRLGSPPDLVSLPLYDKRGRSTLKNGRVGCGSCHDPHKWSPLPYNKQVDPKELEGDTDSSFLRIADQGKSKLCLNCHIDKESIMFTKHDLTDEPMDYISKTLANKTDNVSAGAVKGVCMHCHKPHDAKGPALWARKQTNAAAPIARLCQDCHQKGAIAESKLTDNHSHPVGVSMAGLSSDSRIPVFDATGNRTDHGGNVDCASCHDPHQWSPENSQLKSMSLDDDEGDASNSFLRLPANHQSKLCVTCHADKKTILDTDHDLSVTAPKDKNALQQTRDVSGLCGQCHVPHNAKEKAYLWSRALGKGANPIDQRCRSCHQDKKVASAKNPAIANHPESINIWSGELRKQITGQAKDAMPAFDDKGKRTTFGEITCASCHDPHRWSASHNKAGTGKNLEGDAESSFLRLDDTSGFICADCHGLDGLFRYKYFHGESSHKKHHMYR